MLIKKLLPLLATASLACVAAPRAVPTVPPLGREAQVDVYLQPLPHEADRLSFTIESAALRRADGGEVPLEVAQPVVRGADARLQRPFARGRVAPGEYHALLVKVAAASVVREGDVARLVVPPEAVPLEIEFRARPGSATVVWAELKPAEALGAEYAFTPAFRVRLAPQTPPEVALYCTDAGEASVTVIDRSARLLTGAVPVGAIPRGIVLDRMARRAYVALGGEDQIQLVDVAANAPLDTIRLSPGDGPREIGFAADGTTLVVVNQRSRTVSFVDVNARTELGRVPVGDSPETLLIDRSGRRAYVVNRMSATISVIDIGTRTVVATLATDPEPLRAQLSRDGSRLYVVHRGSAYLAVFALPSMAAQPRVYVGLGATTLRVDARTDLLYVSRGDQRRISVYDPLGLQPIDDFDVPDAVSYMAIDDMQNTLLAVMPRRRAIAVIDLTSRKILTEVPVGLAPYLLAFVGERT